jgi:hypothetical protein
VPEISRFFGIVVRLHYVDHNPPHFHATYQGRTVEIEIRTLAVIHGTIASRALGLVMEWAAQRQAELTDDWRRAASGEPIVRIEPLS